jgi:hypothetical protein
MQNKVKIINALIWEIATGDKAWYLFDTRWFFFMGAFLLNIFVHFLYLFKLSSCRVAHLVVPPLH